MSAMALFVAVVIVVFIGALLSARRFGVLALALTAGSVLAGMWSSWLAGQLVDLGVSLSWLPAGVLATVVLLVAPLMLLLISGPKYHGKFERIMSAVGVGILTAAFLIQPLGRFVMFEGAVLSAYVWLGGVWQYVVTVGVVVGVVDLFLMHSQKAVKPGKKH